MRESTLILVEGAATDKKVLDAIRVAMDSMGSAR